jgi:hypothetical protein
MVQFLWQDDLVSVAKFVSVELGIMLGADSDDEIQAYNQPWVAGTDVITRSLTQAVTQTSRVASPPCWKGAKCPFTHVQLGPAHLPPGRFPQV